MLAASYVLGASAGDGDTLRPGTSRESRHVLVDSTGAESGPLPVINAISLPWEPTFPPFLGVITHILGV